MCVGSTSQILTTTFIEVESELPLQPILVPSFDIVMQDIQ